jgi:hypothetical protein
MSEITLSPLAAFDDCAQDSRPRHDRGASDVHSRWRISRQASESTSDNVAFYWHGKNR